MRIRFIIILLSICLSIVSCEKEKCLDTFRISKEGGCISFDNIELDGSTLITSDGYEIDEPIHNPYYGYWESRISWFSATYYYDKKMILVTIDENNTGRSRICKIHGQRKDGEMIYYRVKQGS